MKLWLILSILLTSNAYAEKKVAIVKLLRGEVNVWSSGKSVPLKIDDWVNEGSVVKTAAKSFVKLIFIDKSQMNVGPLSEMKIESFSGKDSGVLDLVKGKVRSQVSKDYLQMNKDKSKLFIKTANAVMGVRGTDFLLASNGKTTSTVLFEGEIAFNKLDNRAEIDTQNLELIVDRGVQMYPGEFSVLDGRDSLPTVPALLNIQQRENLERSESFEAVREPASSVNNGEPTRTLVPEGLTGSIVGNDASAIKPESVSVTAGTLGGPSSKNPDAYVEGSKVKPANGSFLHVDTGTIIPPGPESIYDGNSNTYIPSQGSVASNGDVIPPGSTTLSGGLALAPPPPPVVMNDILSPTVAPGGLQDLSDFQRNTTGGLQTTQQLPITNVNFSVNPAD